MTDIVIYCNTVVHRYYGDNGLTRTGIIMEYCLGKYIIHPVTAISDEI
jgi:hypothetical protein